MLALVAFTPLLLSAASAGSAASLSSSTITIAPAPAVAPAGFTLPLAAQPTIGDCPSPAHATSAPAKAEARPRTPERRPASHVPYTDFGSLSQTARLMVNTPPRPTSAHNQASPDRPFYP